MTPFLKSYLQTALWSSTGPKFAPCPCCEKTALLTYFPETEFDQEEMCSTCGVSEVPNFDPLDRNYSLSDISPDALARAEKDCQAFQRENETALALSGLTDERAGHSLWLNRNGHGSGFWDEYSQTTCEANEREQAIALGSRDFSKRDALKLTCNCPYHACERLSDSARAMGTCDVLPGDDGKLYFC